MKLAVFSASLFATTAAFAQGVSQNVANFSFPQPANTQSLKKLGLWGTWYFLPQMTAVSEGGQNLFAPNGQSLGVALPHRDYCIAAMEGSVRIRMGTNNKTYNWGGKAPDLGIDCGDVFKKYPKQGNIYWREAHSPFGDGADRGDGLPPWALIPFRSLAVDPNTIPFETVLYIPQARGVNITLPDGRKVTHDGYFIANDRGGLIKENHVDVFIGTATDTPFDFVTSDPKDTFSAYEVKDPAILREIREASQPKE
jgi:hypothetical protein